MQFADIAMAHRHILLFGLGLLSALAGPASAHAYGFDSSDEAFSFLYLSTPIAIHGRVVDERGLALDGAQLRLIGWGEAIVNDGEATTSWTGGSFDLPNLARRNVLLEVSLAGYYTEVIPIELQRPIDEELVELPDITLVAEQFGRARLSFAGDAMFGRRMFDRGILHQAKLAADTKALFRFVEPVLHADDHTAINLETSVTDHLLTPHPSKAYVFNSYPESATVLDDVGVDSVSLGNNHVYDYMAVGLVDTIANLSELGLPFYGAGLDASDAAASVHRPTIHGLKLSLQGFCGLSGSWYGSNALELIATDQPDKPGALYASSEQLDAFVDAEVAKDRVAIPIIHGGIEYAELQSPEIRGDLVRAIARGATLVVAHHPHVVHGVQLVDAGEGPRYVFGSLGNFVFDQEIFETLRSYIAVVDITDTGLGPAVDRVRLVPMVRDDYAPRLLVGDALAKFGRHVAQLSTNEAGLAGLIPAIVFAEGGRLVVEPDDSSLTITDLVDARELDLVGGYTGVIALDPFTQTDALASLRSASPASCELGRDRLLIGDFEEPDVDANADEADLWSLSSSAYTHGVDVHSGARAAVLLRHASQKFPTTLSMIRRVSVSPGGRVTVYGWHAGDNAGIFGVRVRWLHDDGSTLSSAVEYKNSDGNFDWSSFAVDLSVPNGAASMQVDFELASPDSSEGRVLLDDLAFIEWAPVELDVDPTGVELPSPNGWDFVRCTAAGQTLALTLTHRTYATARHRFVPRLPGNPTFIRARSN